MSRASPAVRRAIVVLNFFAEHPRQAFTLTEVATSLRLSRATTHGILASFVEAGYLYRGAGKSYMLGPAVTGIARLVLDSFSPLQAARPEMRAIADKYDVVCSALFREGDEVVIHERAASVSHLGWTIPHQIRTPMVPPFGGVFLAWAPQTEIDAWLDTARSPEPEFRRELEASLAFLRSHGYAYGYRTVPLEGEEGARRLLSNAALTNYAVTDLDPERTYNLAYVVAPVFDAYGQPAFALATVGHVKPLDGRAVDAIGQDLRARCDRIGSFITGLPPPVRRMAG